MSAATQGGEDTAPGPSDPGAPAAPRWSAARGRRCDLWLCATALAVGSALAISVAACALGAGYRGTPTLLKTAALGAALLVPARRLARRLEARLAARRPEYFGELLDGLWLPRPVRLSCWLVAAVGPVAIYFYATHWAPQSPWDAKADELHKVAATRDEEFKRLPPTDASVEERGRLAWEAEAARQGEDYVRGGPPPAIFLRPTGPRPPVERGRPWTDPVVNWGDQPSFGYEPNPKVPTKASRREEYQNVQEVNEGGRLQLGILTLPLAPVFALIGWGSSTTYTNRIVKSVHTVFEGQVLSADELYALVDEVPRHGLSNWQDRFTAIVNEAKAQGKLTDAQSKQFLANLDEAVARAMREKQKQDSELVRQLAALIQREVGKNRTPAQVVASVRGVLPGEFGGRFPSRLFTDELKATVLPSLGGKTAYWDQIAAELNPKN